MDINQLLSILQTVNNSGNVQETLPPPPPPGSTVPVIPTSAQLGAIDPDVILQVRQELIGPSLAQQTLPLSGTYQQQETLDQLLDQVQETTKINSKVLLALGRMTKETNLIQVLQECKEAQHRKEKELSERRQEIVDRHQKLRDSLFAKELVGITADWEGLEKQTESELRKMDVHVLREMDKETRIQQDKMAKLRVPFFKVTANPDDVKMQHKILSILQDMIDEEGQDA